MTSQISNSVVRVRYAETDQMGIAYYGHYFTWFEVGRTDLLRKLGTTYRQMEENGFLLPVIETRCQYHSPALYDDLLKIDTTISRPSRAKLRFDYKLERQIDSLLLASGTTLHVTTDRKGSPCRPPELLLKLVR